MVKPHKSKLTRKDFEALSPSAQKLLKAIFARLLPNPDKLSPDELYAVGRELMEAGLIEIRSDARRQTFSIHSTDGFWS